MGQTSETDDPLSTALDPSKVLPVRIEHWYATQPDRPYLVEAASGRAETFGSFRDLIRRWATLLADHGVQPGDRVVSLLPSSIDAHAVWLGASLLGAFEVPVNPELRGEFLRHVLTDSGATVCVVRPEQVAVIDGSGVAGLHVLVAPADGSTTSAVAPMVIDRLPTPDDVSCVIYTSGTTGPAKGVVIRWAQMSALIGRIPVPWLDGADAVYSPWPMFHVTGRSPMLVMADVGGRVALREKFVLDEFWSDVRTHRCTSTTIGAVTGLLLAQTARPDDADNPLRHVLFGKVGYEGVRFLTRFDVVGICCYGSTEVGFPIINRAIDETTRDVIGWLRPGYEARVEDHELWIKPPDRRMILREYLNHPQRTADAVVDGWYRTGDAVREVEGGGFVFVDRLRDTIRRFGENISSAALESVVVGDPDVIECAAVGVPSPTTGQEILLVVVPREGADRDPAALSARLRAVLPRHMNPAYITFVDELAKTPNGKIRKVDLAARFDLDTLWSTRR